MPNTTWRVTLPMEKCSLRVYIGDYICDEREDIELSKGFDVAVTENILCCYEHCPHKEV